MVLGSHEMIVLFIYNTDFKELAFVVRHSIRPHQQYHINQNYWSIYCLCNRKNRETIILSMSCFDMIITYLMAFRATNNSGTLVNIEKFTV